MSTDTATVDDGGGASANPVAKRTKRGPVVGSGSREQDDDLDKVVKSYVEIAVMKKRAHEELEKAKERKKAVNKAEKEIRNMMIARMQAREMSSYHANDLAFRVVVRESLTVSKVSEKT